MFYSQCRLSGKGPLGAIWVAAYFYKKLKKAQVTATDISSSIDQILQDEFNVVTYRILAYFLLGIVRIYSKKVEYLFDDCNKMFLQIKDFVARNKNSTPMETLRAPYFSITLPKRFELDAFDLEILEDTSGGNVMPREEITLKDDMWKTGEMERFSLDKYDFEGFTACQNTCSVSHTLTEDAFKSHLMDLDMEVASLNISNSRTSMEKLRGNGFSQHEGVELETFSKFGKEPPDPSSAFKSHLMDLEMEGTSHNISNSHKSMEKLLGNRFSQHDCVELETFSEFGKELPDPAKSFGEDHQTEGEQTKFPEMVDSDEMHVEANVQKLCDDSFYYDLSLNLETFTGMGEEPVNPVESLGEHYQTDGQQISAPDIPQSNCHDQANEHQINFPDMEQSENGMHLVTKEDSNPSDVKAILEKLRGYRMSPKENMNIGMLSAVQEPQEHARPFGEEHLSDVKRINFLETSSGVEKCEVVTEDIASSIRVDATPQSKFLNALVKRGSTTPEFLAICTPVTREGARTIRKRKCIVDDVIVFPNSVVKQWIDDSSDLISKRRKAPHTTLAARKAHQVSNLPRCLLEPLIPCTSLELRSLFCEKKLKIPESIEIVEPGGISVFEFPAVRRLFGTEESSEKLDMYESHAVDRSVEAVEPLEKSNVPTSLTASRLVETMEPPGNLNMSESHFTGGCSEVLAMAPATPTRQTASLRSFESPVKPGIVSSDRETLEFESAEEEPFSSKDDELHLNLVNDELNSNGGDNQDSYGLLERTRVVATCLHASFLSQKKRKNEDVVNLSQLMEGRTKKESARVFYEILVLKSKGYVHVKQENGYGDILVWKTSEWDRAWGARLSMERLGDPCMPRSSTFLE